MKNVVIYVDYENIHNCFLKEYKNCLREGFFEKLRRWCLDHDLRILDIKVYCNFDSKDLHDSYHQTKLQEYGLETFHTSNKGKNYADLKISTDLLEELYENDSVNGFILISNDKDMTPLIKAIKRYKEFVYLVTSDNDYDKSLSNFPDKHVKFSEILNENDVDILNKELELLILNSLDMYLQEKLLKNASKAIIGLEHYINTSHMYFKIPIYEFVENLNLLYKKNLIHVFDYSYGSNNYKGVLTANTFNDYISKGIIKSNEIDYHYDFSNLIKAKYDEYIKN